jgi:hypothetical protein
MLNAPRNFIDHNFCVAINAAKRNTESGPDMSGMPTKKRFLTLERPRETIGSPLSFLSTIKPRNCALNRKPVAKIIKSNSDDEPSLKNTLFPFI